MLTVLSIEFVFLAIQRFGGVGNLSSHVFTPQTHGSGPSSCQSPFSLVPWEVDRGGVSNDGAISRHLLTFNAIKWKGAEESAWQSAGAWRQAGTFQTRLHKSRLWQLISNSHSTCPDISARSMRFSTRAPPTLPRLHPSVSNPLDLFDLYLFIAIAAAACAPTELNSPVIWHKKTHRLRYDRDDEWASVEGISGWMHVMPCSEKKNLYFWP